MEDAHMTLGINLVRKLAGEGMRVFTAAQARAFAHEVGLSENYFRQALHHLVNSGWLIRLRKGLYTLSSAVPGISAAHEFEIAMAFVNPAAISHWSALNYHGLTEQAPRKVFVLTTRGSGIPRTKEQDGSELPIGGIYYKFIQVEPRRYFGTEKVWVSDAKITITDPERTLIDGLMMPQYCGDFAEVLHAFRVIGSSLDLNKIINYVLKLDAACAKRLGWVLEGRGFPLSGLRPLLDLAIKGYRPLDPTGPRKGPCNRRWQVQVNLPGKVEL